MTADLRQRIAEALLADIKRAAMPLKLLPGQVGHLGARTHYDLAEAVLAVVQPELDQLRAQRPGCPDPVECDHEASAGQALAEAAQLRAELDRTRAELDQARDRLASYGTPIKQFPPLPPDDETHAKKAALRAELERTGTTEWAHADGRGLCPERDHCPSGLLALFVLTKRGRLPVHGNDYHRCDGSGQKPAVVLRLPDPAAVSAPTTT